MKAGRKRLAGDTAREANTGEVQGLRREAPHLMTSPVFVVIKTADEFRDKTTAINQLWQTDFTYIKIVGFKVVLSFHHSRRLLSISCRLEAVHHDKGE